MSKVRIVYTVRCSKRAKVKNGWSVRSKVKLVSMATNVKARNCKS